MDTHHCSAPSSSGAQLNLSKDALAESVAHIGSEEWSEWKENETWDKGQAELLTD